MKIVIDGYYLSKTRGLGRYIRELVYALAEHPKAGFELHLLVPRNLGEEFRPTQPCLHIHDLPSLPFPVWEQIIVPLACRNIGADILHSGYNTLPLVFMNWPGQIQFIHDVMFMDSNLHVSNLYQCMGMLYRRYVVKLAQRGQQTLLCPTSKTADDILAHIQRHSEVVPIPLDLFSKAPSEFERPVTNPYLLHIGGTQAHKNTTRCVEAFLAGAPEDYSLVVMGVPEGWKQNIFPSTPRIIVPGKISEKTLATYYRHAAGALFASLREGFGLPVIEAFVHGLPLITSDREPMRELAGDAALLVDPENIDEITAAIHRITIDTALCKTLVARGRARLSSFSGVTTAERMQQLFERISMRGTV